MPMTKKNQYGLSKAQMDFCELYITSGLSIYKIAEKMGVNKHTCYAWMGKPEVKKYLGERTEAHWDNIAAKATEKLLENIDLNDTKAITYALDHSLFKGEDKFNLPEITINIGKNKDEE